MHIRNLIINNTYFIKFNKILPNLGLMKRFDNQKVIYVDVKEYINNQFYYQFSLSSNNSEIIHLTENDVREYLFVKNIDKYSNRLLFID